MTQSYFITGTDTDVGKTICCKALLQAANQRQLSTLAYKPIAAGCEMVDGLLYNHDARVLQETSSIAMPYQAINPIAFELPIAPHIAASLDSKAIDLEVISNGLDKLQKQQPDVLIVEGAGGWRLPINDQTMLSDWVVGQQLPVILVVGMKLGCLNHAILTYESIVNDGLQVVGWIANQLQSDMPYYEQNMAYLRSRINAPRIGEIPYCANIEKRNLAQYIDFDY